MDCPICNLKDIKPEENICSNCGSDLQFLKQINIVSKKVRTTYLLLFLACIAIILNAAATLFLYFKAKKLLNQSYAEITELRVIRDLYKTTMRELKVKSQDKEEDIKKEDIKQEHIEYIVGANDNLWRISLKFYGDGNKYIKIAKDNNIENPDKINEGMKLIIIKNNSK